MRISDIQHTYGAEAFQRNYPRQALTSFASASIIMLLLFAFPLIRSFFDVSKDEEVLKVKVKRTINYSELSAPPPIDLERQEVILTAPPKMKVTKFLQPVAKKDVEVEETTAVPTMDELENAQIGTVDIDGIDSILYEETTVVSEPPEPLKEEPLGYVQVMPQFEGGQAALLKYIANEIDYPRFAEESGIEGIVYVQFVVEKDGSISEVKILRGVQRSLDEEALRVISKMDNWIPGSQNGVKARVLFTIPIRFVLKQ